MIHWNPYFKFNFECHLANQLANRFSWIVSKIFDLNFIHQFAFHSWSDIWPNHPLTVSFYFFTLPSSLPTPHPDPLVWLSDATWSFGFKSDAYIDSVMKRCLQLLIAIHFLSPCLSVTTHVEWQYIPEDWDILISFCLLSFGLKMVAIRINRKYIFKKQVFHF